MFASGTTQEAGLLRGRRRQSMMITSAERRRRKYAQWQNAQKMFCEGGDKVPTVSLKKQSSSTSSASGGAGGSSFYRQRGKSIDLTASGSKTEAKDEDEPALFEIPISNRRQVSLCALNDDDEEGASQTSSGSSPDKTRNKSNNNDEEEQAPSSVSLVNPSGGSAQFFVNSGAGSCDIKAQPMPSVSAGTMSSVSSSQQYPHRNRGDDQLTVTFENGEPSSRRSYSSSIMKNNNNDRNKSNSGNLLRHIDSSLLQFQQVSEANLAKKQNYFAGRIVVPGEDSGDDAESVFSRGGGMGIRMTGGGQQQMMHYHHHRVPAFAANSNITHQPAHFHNKKNKQHQQDRRNISEQSSAVSSYSALTNVSKIMADMTDADQRVRAASASRVSFAAQPVLMSHSKHHYDDEFGNSKTASAPALNFPAGTGGSKTEPSTIPAAVKGGGFIRRRAQNSELPSISATVPTPRISPSLKSAEQVAPVILTKEKDSGGDGSSDNNNNNQIMRRHSLMRLESQSVVVAPPPIATSRRQTGQSVSSVPANILASLRRLRPIVLKTVPSEREQQSAEHQCPPGQCRFVRINVSGLLFEICASYLDRHPKTLLGDKHLMSNYWEPRRKEYFFDRHRPSFEGIFAFLKYGDVPRKPDGVPDDVFLDELYFFRIEDEIIDQWKTSRGMPIFEPQKYILKKEDHCFRRLWYMFEFPAHSRMSYALNIISVIAAIVAVCCLIFESLPNVSTSHCLEDGRPNFGDKFFIIETACTAWFTLELFCRTVGAPSWRDLITYQTGIDIAANAPYYVILISVLISMDCSGAKSSASTGFLRIFRLFSVFKLSDRSGAFALIMNTFKASTRVLTLFFLALAVCVVLFGSFIYIIEAETDAPQSEFQSIADGFWWAVITMTTVGYGDLIPRTVAGKIVGSCCAIVGVITLSMPIPILTENFNKFYKQMKKRKSMINS